MHKNPRYALLVLLITALLVSVLFNFRIFLWVLVNGLTEQIRPRLSYHMFNFIIEFVVFFLAGLLNYSWTDTLIRRFSLRKWKIPLIALCNLLVFFILIPLGKLFHTWYFLGRYENKEMEFEIQNYLVINISVFLLAIVVANLLLLMKKMRIAEQENLQLIEEKSKAELSALKEQLSPHFFFNTLSTLSSIVRNEKKEVGLEFIGEISKTYQYTLATKQDLIPLKEEMAFLESYVYILKRRFGDKLSFSQDLSEDQLSFKIPPMSLQLLVENAIQHNVITKETPLHIRIFAEKEMVCVENNLQEKESDVDSFGIGLQNLSNRYRLLSQKDIIITKEKHKFGVKLPLL
jgi:two-component system LytT family sensor kinase